MDTAFRRSSSFLLPLLLFLTLMLAVLYQGGEYLWFGFAVSSVLLTLVFGMIRNLDKPLSLPTGFEWKVLWAFLFWVSLTTLWSISYQQSIFQSIQLALLGLGVLIYFFWVKEDQNWTTIWYPVLVVGIILCGLQLYQAGVGVSRPPSLFINPNTFAAFLNLIILPTVALYFLSAKKHDKYFIGVLVILIFSFGLTGGRAALAAQLVGLAMLLIFSRGKVDNRKLLFFVAVYTVTMLLASLQTGHHSRIIDIDVERTANLRLVIWYASFDMWADTPWFGNGLGTYWLLYPQYRYPADTAAGQNAHNDFLQTLVETGIPGLLLLIMAMALIAWSGIRFLLNPNNEVRKKLELAGLFAALLTATLHSFFSYVLGPFSILLLMGLILGRYLSIAGHTRSYQRFSIIGARRPLAIVLVSTVSAILVIQLMTLSAYSYFFHLAKAHKEHGQIELADSANAKAVALFPYDDRGHLLYADIHIDILEKIPELSMEQKRQYFEAALGYLQRARQLNPYREGGYYLHAQLLQIMDGVLVSDVEQTIIDLYLECLRTNPKFIPARRELAKYYLELGNPEAAVQVILDSTVWYYHDVARALRYFNFAETVMKDHASFEDQQIFADKHQRVKEHFARKYGEQQ